MSEYPAQTYARNTVDVRGRVDGYIDKWLFRPGQEVTRAMPFTCWICGRFRRRCEQAKGNLEQSEADLEFARKQVSLLQAQANLAAAQANLVKAQQDYERLKPLVEAGCRRQAGSRRRGRGAAANEANVRAKQANVDQTRLSTETQIESTAGKGGGAARRASTPRRSTSNTGPSARPSAA